MSFSLVRSRALTGVHAPEVAVETHLANGLPSFTIVGLPQTAIKESRDRVRSAIVNSNFAFPSRKITVNLAPADLPKEGAKFDLPIAISILIASEQIRIDRTELLDYEFIGELALDGRLRAVAGILPVAYAITKAGRKLVLPKSCVTEAALIRNSTLLSGSTLTRLIDNLIAGRCHAPDSIKINTRVDKSYSDLADVRGQYLAKRALEIAAAGRHNLLMIGPPGCGKSMLAARLPGILPLMSERTAIESASIRSVSRQGFHLKDWRRTPYRAPHHGCSPAALIGGGSKPVPGEISLAHGGVLFLDEIPEFDRRALEMLREPLDAGYVNIARVNYNHQYLADIMLVAAANPCHCGHYGSTVKACRCTPTMIERYQNKLSGPLIDRFDMHVELTAVSADQLVESQPAEKSIVVAKRVQSARQRQINRQGKLNSNLQPAELEQELAHDDDLKSYLNLIIKKLSLTARSYHRILRLCRTIADLDKSVNISKKHVNQAVQYRIFDRN